MTISKGVGRGKHGKHKAGPGRGNVERYSPPWFLKQYKTTQRPLPCVKCRQNAYYNHPDFGFLCAPHLLDLVNIGQVHFKWEDYPEIWDRTERLLQRPAPPLSTTAKNMESMHVQKPRKSDG
jgi:hypothetical protein